MTSPRPARLALLFSAALIAAALAGCSTSAVTDSPTSTPPSASATPTPTATPDASAGSGEDRYATFCAANGAAAAAKAGTVGEDLEAVKAQGVAIRALLPMTDVSSEIAAGAEVFAISTDETAGILAQFPADTLVSDVGLDPRFTQSQSMQSAMTDPNYQAFIAWTIETCGLGSGENGNNP
ncbi:hypothetical protein SAMN06295879_2184 [Agreia bicolorata]|uniref:Uncharacterized protein n=1 Tax=Agreia bicolorata TaxID=110935 RepID=A0A1T4Y3D1_9MICO|nr:hypothetical protein [Agreia bicolorata]SKA96256.1 hypothetical protein SAMN06295879_2184 [Agreia bicolorata]